jgi:hypothetical protein
MWQVKTKILGITNTGNTFFVADQLPSRLKNIQSNFVFRQNGENSFKNDRMRAVSFRPLFLVELIPILAEAETFEFLPNWRSKISHLSNFDQIG